MINVLDWIATAEPWKVWTIGGLVILGTAALLFFLAHVLGHAVENAKHKVVMFIVWLAVFAAIVLLSLTVERGNYAWIFS